MFRLQLGVLLFSNHCRRLRKEIGNLRKQLQTGVGMLKRLLIVEIILHHGGAAFRPVRCGGR